VVCEDPAVLSVKPRQKVVWRLCSNVIVKIRHVVLLLSNCEVPTCDTVHYNYLQKWCGQSGSWKHIWLSETMWSAWNKDCHRSWVNRFFPVCNTRSRCSPECTVLSQVIVTGWPALYILFEWPTNPAHLPLVHSRLWCDNKFIYKKKERKRERRVFVFS
jgi:hypothetical protein